MSRASHPPAGSPFRARQTQGRTEETWHVERDGAHVSMQTLSAIEYPTSFTSALHRLLNSTFQIISPAPARRASP